MYAQPIVGVWCDSSRDRGELSDDECPFRPRWREILHESGIATRCFGGCVQLASLDGMLADLDGLLLISTRDLQPGSALEASRASNTPPKEMIQHASERELPFLGIGMGIQLLNVAFGGTLQSVSNDPHWGTPHIQPHHPRHSLVISPGSRLAKSLDRENLMVRSSHRVAIKQVADGFRVSGRSPEGAVEAIESQSDNWAAVAVQFEPDTDAGCPMDIRLIEDFAEQVWRGRQGPMRKPR